MQSETMTYTNCQNCGRWFRIGMRFATPEKFEDASIKKTIMVCPYCNKRTAVKKQYLRFDEVRIDGRITHTQGKYFL